MFDAIAVVLTAKAAEKLTMEAAAVQFVGDAFGHLKAIGFTKEAMPLLEKAGVSMDDGVKELGKDFTALAAKRYWAREPKVRTLA